MFGLKRDRKLKLIASIIAGIGAYVMGYLTRLHFTEAGSSVCDISEKLSCGIVNKSAYAEVIGIPVSILGLIFFLSIPYLLYAKPFKKPWRLVLLASVFSLVFGLYLSWIEQAVIYSICLFCESSKVLIIALIGISAYAVKHEKENLPKSWIFATALSGIVFSFVVYFLQT